MREIMKFNATHAAVFVLGAMLIGGGQAAADQVIPDDLIVQGSECVGLDCVNNENFGFSTLRLKENNLRIEFLDTSTAAGFASNDWELIANDSAQGGASYFSIDDTTNSKRPFSITAGAPTSSLFVSSTGKVGLGTAAPTLNLHVNASDTPAIRLDQNAAGGFTAQTWDIAGNEANFFVRDVTGGSRLPFRIRPGAPTSSIDISATGNVGIGTASPAAKLHIVSPSAVIRLQGDGGKFDLTADNGSNLFRIFDNGGNVRFAIDPTGNIGIGTTSPGAQLHTTGSVRFAGVANCAAGIVSNAAGTLSCAVSSARFKDIRGVLAAETAVANVMALQPRVGTYKETPDVPEHWLIAEDVAAVDPALVGFRDGEPYTVKTQNIVADLVAVIQEQQRRIDALERAIAAR